MIRFSKYLLALFLVILYLTGCENDIEKINRLTEGANHPKLTGTNVEIMFSDSGKVKVQILAQELVQYPDLEKPYLEFPKGLEVFFYNDSLEIESKLRANYTIYYTEEKFWHATGDVEAQNLANGNQLNTEELFWDEEKELIYSNTFTKIQNEDGIWYGKNGFESSQNLNDWELKGTSGTLNVRDED